jgi:hypothetical protein
LASAVSFSQSGMLLKGTVDLTERHPRIGCNGWPDGGLRRRETGVDLVEIEEARGR